MPSFPFRPARARRAPRIALWCAALVAAVAWGSPPVSHGDELRQARECIERGAYARAETLAIVVGARARLDGDSPRLADALEIQCEAMARGGRFWLQEALDAGTRSLAIRERVLGSHHPDLSGSLIALARVRGARGEHQAASADLHRALDVLRREDPEHPRVGHALRELGIQKMMLARYAAAESAIGKAESILIRTHPDPLHPERVANRYALAWLAWLRGSADTTELERTIEATEVALGAWHPLLAERMIEYAGLLRNQAHYARADRLLERALIIQERALGENLLTLRALHALGVNRVWRGDGRSVIPLLERCVATAGRIVGTQHGDYARVLSSLGAQLHRTGEQAAARPKLERAIAIMEQLEPPDPDLPIALEHLGEQYLQTGEVDRARALLERVLSIRGQAGIADSASLGKAFDLLGQCENDPDRRLELYERAAFCYISGSIPTRAARGWGLLGQVRCARGDHAEGIELRKRSNAMFVELRGPASPDLAWGLQALGECYAAAGRDSLAIECFERSVEAFRVARGPESWEFGMVLRMLATHRVAAGRPRGAFAAARLAEHARRAQVRRNAERLPDALALQHESAWISGAGEGRDLMLALASGPLRSDPTLPRQTWDELIRSRSLVLDILGARHQVRRSSRDSTTRALTGRVEEASRRLSNLDVRGPRPGDEAAFALRRRTATEERDDAERALAEHTRRQERDRKRIEVGFDEMVRALPPRTAVVAYARFENPPLEPPHPEGVAPESTMVTTRGYVAFVLPGDGSDPEAILLGGLEIDSLITAWQSSIREGAGLDHRAAGREAEYRRVGAALRAAIWDPFEGRLSGADRILVIPDAGLHLVNWMALPQGASGYLIEGPPIHVLSAERDLVREPSPPGTGLLAVGAPAYDGELDARVPAADSLGVTLYRGPRSSCEAFRSFRFPALAESRREVEDIAGLWSRSGLGRAEDVEVLIGGRASETTLKRWTKRKRVVHLATHGFFLDGRCEPAAVGGRGIGGLARADSVMRPPGQSALLLSGLVLAGANRREEASHEQDDGILTADEIAALDLEGLEWAVLSACETGLGTISPSEGVLGLRRAFQIAGARTTIMSLWAVSDDAAREWMSALYRARLVRGLGTAEAVRAAGLEMLESRRRAARSTHPAAWSAFIAVGDHR